MSSFLELKKSNYSIFVKITGALLIISCFFFISGCNKNLDRDRPMQAEEKRKRNIKEGRGASIGNVLGGIKKGTNYEFSTSNPMWRASLDTLDFLPLATVDYSGGVIITDWYTDSSSNQESIKISLRFLSNDVRSESLKITVHKKTCLTNQNCKTIILSNTKIKEELHATILRKAALLEKESKKKKKK
jgi:hypothetical protein